MTYGDVLEMALGWPGVIEATSYGTPALKVGRKLLTRLKEDGDSLVALGVGFDERDMLIEAQPQIFYVTDHYRDWPIVLFRLSRARPEILRPLLWRQWRAIAPKKLAASFPDNGPV